MRLLYLDSKYKMESSDYLIGYFKNLLLDDSWLDFMNTYQVLICIVVVIEFSILVRSRHYMPNKLILLISCSLHNELSSLFILDDLAHSLISVIFELDLNVLVFLWMCGGSLVLSIYCPSIQESWLVWAQLGSIKWSAFIVVKAVAVPQPGQNPHKNFVFRH